MAPSLSTLLPAGLLLAASGAALAAPESEVPASPDPTGSLHLSAQGGMVLPLVPWDLGQDHRALGVVPDVGAGAMAGGAVGYHFTRRLSAELEVFATSISTNVQTDATALSYGATASYAFTDGPVSPYAIAGGGVYHAPDGLLATDLDPVLRVGAGVQALFPERVGVRVDVRYAATDGFEAFGAPNVELRVAADLFLDTRHRHHSCGPDFDGDGLLDANDACYDQPGPAAMHGCPDSDRDGIDDTADACPLDAGPLEDEGCPDPDGDWVADHKDWCPDRPGLAELGGCPEVSEAEMLTALQDVPFHFSSAALTPEAKENLALAASFLRENPLVRVRVEGHTDNLGDPAVNQTVSELRAAAVVNQLVMLGVSRERLEPTGLADSQPVAENDRREGRAQNRRAALVGTVSKPPTDVRVGRR